MELLPRTRINIRSLFRAGSTLALLVGLTILVVSTLAIKQSLAIGAGSEYVPSLVSFENSVSDKGVAPIQARQGDLIGTLTIPRIKKTIPIYEGTEKEQLSKGAGHYTKSVLPGLSDNSVLAGHRDSVFSKFSTLKKGDLLLITTTYGNFTYKIQSFRVVDADDRTVIVPTKVATLTLSTCYPFRYIGNAPKRFIVSALLV